MPKLENQNNECDCQNSLEEFFQHNVQYISFYDLITYIP